MQAAAHRLTEDTLKMASREPNCPHKQVPIGASSVGRFPKNHGCAGRCAVSAPFGRKNHGCAGRSGARRRSAGRRRGAPQPSTWANAIRAPAAARQAPAAALHNRGFFAPWARRIDIALHNRGFPARRLAGRGSRTPHRSLGLRHFRLQGPFVVDHPSAEDLHAAAAPKPARGPVMRRPPPPEGAKPYALREPRKQEPGTKQAPAHRRRRFRHRRTGTRCAPLFASG